jgi:16S rRNA (cytosine1402-N4)-methyltransferase
MSFENSHISVLLPEVIEALFPRDGGVYLDGTFGGGGYTRALLESSMCSVHALDRDPDAALRAKEFLHTYPGRFFFHQGCFSDLKTFFPQRIFDGAVFDFGVSSFQLDTPDRGFSFRFEGPLDMRMTPDRGQSAATVVNTFSESDIADILYIYGEEKRARGIARAIVERRKEKPFKTTRELAELVRAHVFRKDGLDPSTLTFQALRIFVNNELIEIQEALQAARRFLKNQGILITVTFHALEDRLVKNFIKDRDQHMAKGVSFSSINRRALTPSQDELRANPRSRSAKLRAIECLCEGV